MHRAVGVPGPGPCALPAQGGRFCSTGRGIGAYPVRTMMKLGRLFLFLLAAASLFLASCQTATPPEGASQGISSEGIGISRERVYEWQDRTFRQLAY